METRRQVDKPVPQVPFVPAEHRRVDGYYQRAAAGSLRARDQLRRPAAVGLHVELEPRHRRVPLSNNTSDKLFDG